MAAQAAAYGVGIAHYGAGGKVLDTWYPVVNLNENHRTAEALAEAVGHSGGAGSYRLERRHLEAALERIAPLVNDGKPHANVDAMKELVALADGNAAKDTKDTKAGDGARSAQGVVVCFIGDTKEKPADVHDVYLRLHLLSSRKAQPRSLNLDGMIPLLPIVVWTSEGPFDPEAWPQARLKLKVRGAEPKVYAVDKFPRMVDYVIPSGVRIADADRVRLGAHLGEGTTVMHEGFCNFNAGTLGAAMVEGRISAGVIVGKGSDVGGGASIMGTLSGGGTEVVTIGENCLISANAGTGISLGNNCIIEAGCYVTAGSKVKLLPEGTLVKARDLSGKDNLLFWRNSVTGQLEAQPNYKVVALNQQLHQTAAQAGAPTAAPTKP